MALANCILASQYKFHLFMFSVVGRNNRENFIIPGLIRWVLKSQVLLVDLEIISIWFELPDPYALAKKQKKMAINKRVPVEKHRSDFRRSASFGIEGARSSSILTSFWLLLFAGLYRFWRCL